MMLNKSIFHKYIAKANSVWMGKKPPIQVANSVRIGHSSGYRLSPELHGKYEYIWLYEDMLSDFHAWQIVLDEAIRLAVPEGAIYIFRFIENINFNIMKFKNYLGRNILLSVVDIISEHRSGDEVFVIVSIKRHCSEIYSSKKWSFAILTQGNKVDNVVRFCKSVTKQNLNIRDYEIIVYGPHAPQYDEFGVKYVTTNVPLESSNISMKKNEIIHTCSYENIVLVHDRYVLGDDFIKGFNKHYGYDFDFCTVKQFYEEYTYFPGYAKIETSLSWSKVFFLDDEFNYDDQVYINGGFIICKKTVIEKVRFNKLICWNQGEDVELSHQMRQCGVPARINNYSTAMTVGIPTSYTSTFRPIRNNRISILCRVKKKFISILKRNIPVKMKNFIRLAIK